MNEEKWKKYIAYRGLLLFTTGKGPEKGTLAFFLGGVLGCDGKSNERHRKKHHSFDDRKNMGQTAQFVHQNEW